MPIDAPGRVSRVLTAAVCAGIAFGFPGSAVATTAPAPQTPGGAWPGCPPDDPSGPCRWCPGDPPVQTGNHVTNPVVWDETVCHTYWYVYFGQGNVAQNIFEGETPPPPPPPPPPQATRSASATHAAARRTEDGPGRTGMDASGDPRTTPGASRVRPVVGGRAGATADGRGAC